jgi:hypothetical protein
LNVIEPPALGLVLAPVRVALSLIGLPMATGVVAFVASPAQFEMLTAWGGTKSLSAAVNESDERLLR